MTRRSQTIVSLVLAAFLANSAAAVELDWLERYTLGRDREAVLRELIPGTEDYYRFYTLHYQTSGQLDQAETMLGRWQADKDLSNPFGGEHLRQLRDRQHLLTFGSNPERTYAYLRDRLDVDLAHAPPITADERRYPASIPAETFDRERLIEEAIRSQTELSEPSLRFVADKILAAPDRTYAGLSPRWVLERMEDSAYHQLAELVTAELQSRVANTRSFGDLSAHRALTLAALLQLRRDVPEVENSEPLIDEIILRLAPNPDVNLRQSPQTRNDYYRRVYEFAATLPAAYNSLKVHSLYRLLELNAERGIYDLDLFKAYLSLPRQSVIILPRIAMAAGSDAANLARDYSQLITSPPIADEEPLVRDYLEHFLGESADPEQFAGLLKPEYLRQVFAEAKLLHGADDAEQFFRMLSPAQQRELKDRVELQLAKLNAPYTAVDQPQRLTVDIKNVSKLLVRVYKLNTASYYRTRDELLNSDVDLDGLVPTREMTIDYQLPSQQRHREEILLPGVDGRGVWVVDLLGGSLRCRAVIRRGDLQALIDVQDVGHAVTVIDEAQQRVPGATVRLGTREFIADKDGRAIIPFADSQRSATLLLTDGSLTVPQPFEHLAESYSLEAAMYVSRESLRGGNATQIIVRPQLLNGQHTLSLTRADTGTLIVAAKDADGIETKRRFEKLTFSDDRDTAVEFRVPDNCRSITAELQVEVVRVADGRRETLSDSETWEVATSADTTAVSDVFLTRSGEDWVVEVRGRNGEPIAGAALNLGFETTISQNHLSVVAQADEAGQVTFPDSPNLSAVAVKLGDSQPRMWDLHREHASLPPAYHSDAETDLRFAIVPPDRPVEAPSRFALWELRGSRRLRELPDRTSVDGGFVRLGRLAAGDYELVDRATGRKCMISVAAAAVLDGFAVNAARALEVPPAQPFAIRSATAAGGSLRVEVAGASQFTRVHVIASRYLSPDSVYDALRTRGDSLSGRSIVAQPNVYLSGLKLGEEYEYVLRRQYAEKFPGVILPQPSLLLNPWVIDTADNTVQNAAPGDIPLPSAPVPLSEFSKDRSDAQRGSDASSRFASFAFLADPAVVLANLEVVDGVVEVDEELLGPYSILTVVAADPTAIVQRQIYRPLPPLRTIDLRLPRSYKADLALAQRRSLQFVDADHPLRLSEVGLAELQVYRTFGELLPVLGNLNRDNRWAEFAPLANWHERDEAGKLELYSRLACHELHLFLARKDPAFFERVVKPYLANKKEKQLVDDFLLGNDLSPYLQIWRYRQLNAAEKALLSHAIPAARDQVVRELTEVSKLNPVSPELVRQQIESAMLGVQLQLLEETLGESLEAGQMNLYFDADSARFGSAASGAAYGGDMGEGRAGGMGGGMAGYGEAANAPVESRYLDAGQRQLGARRELLQRAARVKPEAAAQNFFGRMAPFAATSLPFYQGLDQTKQWGESQWDRVRGIADTSDSIAANRFWSDLAAADRLAGFTSPHLLEASDSRHASLVALAMVDLPLSSDYQLPSAADAVLSPPHPIAVALRRTVELEPAVGDSKIMIGQSVSRLKSDDSPADDEAAEAAGAQPEITPEYLVNVAYLARLTVTNLSDRQQSVEVLWQIPAGAIALPDEDGSAARDATDSKTVAVEAFSTGTIAYAFYFPAPGEFSQYPPCVSKRDRAIVRGAAKVYKVLERPSRVDDGSWRHVATSGSAEMIRDFLAAANLRKLDWSLVYHRLKDREIYEAVRDVLKANRMIDLTAFGYAIEHRDPQTLSARLSNDLQFVMAIGPHLRCELLTVQPIERKLLEQIEFAPLIVPRAHPLREELEFTNAQLETHYASLLDTIAYGSPLDVPTQLAVVYYHLITNRIGEAVTRFGELRRDATPTQLQYDYLDAYLALHRLDVDRADRISNEHADHPIPRWRQRFAELQEQVAEFHNLRSPEQLAGLPSGDGVRPESGDLAILDRERRQATAAATQPSVRLELQGDQLRIDHANASSAEVNLYAVDLEMLFSKTPFVREGLREMTIAVPTATQPVKFDRPSGVVTLQVPQNLRNRTLLVEATAGASQDTALYYGGELSTYVSEAFGQLQVMQSEDRRPIAGAYVKVYAKHQDGDVRFYKDGYTDLRGRFDYASVSNGDLGTASRLAILVLDPEHGATLHDVEPPK